MSLLRSHRSLLRSHSSHSLWRASAPLALTLPLRLPLWRTQRRTQRRTLPEPQRVRHVAARLVGLDQLLADRSQQGCHTKLGRQEDTRAGRNVGRVQEERWGVERHVAGSRQVGRKKVA